MNQLVLMDSKSITKSQTPSDPSLSQIPPSQEVLNEVLSIPLPISPKPNPLNPLPTSLSQIPDDSLNFLTDIGEDLCLSIGTHPRNEFQTSVSTAMQLCNSYECPTALSKLKRRNVKSDSQTPDVKMNSHYVDFNSWVGQSSQPNNMSSPPRKKTKEGKRRYTENDWKPILDLDADNWARYFVVKKKDGSFTNDCSFRMAKFFKNLLGKTKNVRKLGDGTLCIEAETRAQAELIKCITKLDDAEVETGPHRRLNTSQGVITCRDFLNSKLEDIKEGLAEEGVVDVRRIKRKQGNILVDTASLVLTFDKPKPPTIIEAAFYKLKVRPYIPSPMRCFRCQKFGHTSQRCKAIDQLCVCGKIMHEGECTPPIICVNCGGDHNAKSSDCPVLKEEKEIQKLKTLQQLPYSEARAIVKSKSFAKPESSYAEKARSTPSVVKFQATPSYSPGQTKPALSPGIRGKIVKVGEISPTKFSTPTSGAPVTIRLPTSPVASCSGITEVGSIPPQIIASPAETWQVVLPSRRSQRRRKPTALSPNPKRAGRLKDMPLAGDNCVSGKEPIRRSPRPKWKMVGTDVEASESDGGGSSDHPPVQRQRGRPKKNLST